MVLVPILGSKFHTRMVSSLEHVINEPVGKTPFMPSFEEGYGSTPQIHAAWYKNECDFPTCKKEQKEMKDTVSKLSKHARLRRMSLGYLSNVCYVPQINTSITVNAGNLVIRFVVRQSYGVGIFGVGGMRSHVTAQNRNDQTKRCELAAAKCINYSTLFTWWITLWLHRLQGSGCGVRWWRTATWKD